MSSGEASDASRSRACALVTLRRFADERGLLDVAQFGDGLPFVVRRVYLISDVPEGVVRGHHGHRALDQVLVVVRGRVVVEFHGSGLRRTVVLERGTTGLHLVPGIYSTQQFFDAATLLVLSSGEYDPEGYLQTPEQATGDVGHE